MVRKNTFNGMVKFILTLDGIWPGASCALFYRMFWIVSMATALFCNYRYLVTHIYSVELLDLIDCLCNILAHTKVTVKCIVFWLNQRKFGEILTMMADDWNDCAHSDISMRETASKAKISDRIANGIIILHTAAVFLYGINVILADVDITDHTTELPYITKLDIPFNVSTLRTYRSLLITEFLHLILSVWTAGITNTLLLTLTLHAAGQIDILRNWLTQLVPCENEDKHESVAITTSKIIQKHQKIIDFSENIESIYTYIALVQFVSNTIQICSLGFLVVTAIGKSNMVELIMRSISFYTLTNLEAFIFCFAGEYLKNKSNAIGFAAYNSAWYNLKSKNRHILLFIILRSQKQLTLTAGKMMDLSLESFKNIMNASGSYLSMLLAMQ